VSRYASLDGDAATDPSTVAGTSGGRGGGACAIGALRLWMEA
jgi:hypothetical protein